MRAAWVARSTRLLERIRSSSLLQTSAPPATCSRSENNFSHSARRARVGGRRSARRLASDSRYSTADRARPMASAEVGRPPAARSVPLPHHAFRGPRDERISANEDSPADDRPRLAGGEPHQGAPEAATHRGYRWEERRESAGHLPVWRRARRSERRRLRSPRDCTPPSGSRPPFPRRARQAGSRAGGWSKDARCRPSHSPDPIPDRARLCLKLTIVAGGDAQARRPCAG